MKLPNAQLQTITNAVKAGLLRARARLALVALISLGASAALWRLEHDAQLRRDFELQQLRRAAAAEVANLRARVAAALDDADAGAQRVRDLEARRLQLERAAANSRAEISSLKSKERARLQEVASLPFPALVDRLRSRLGAESLASRDSGPASRTLPVAGSRLPERVTDGTRSAGDSTFQIQDSRSPNPQSRTANPESRLANPETRVANPESGIPSPGILLTEGGARAVAATLVERDACREQAQVKDALLANCQEQAAGSRAALEEMSRSVSSLKEAVRLKGEIESRGEAVHRAELKAARGSRLRRFGRALQYVGAGVVIGVVVAR